jgi:phage repressor protein C with HTH and peptisase S24 domain
MAQAGLDGFFDDAGLPTGDGWSWTDLPRPGRSLFSLEIVGDSMVPLYRPGDQVIVDRDGPEPRRGDRVVVRTLSGETLAKELAALTPSAVTLRSINPDHPDRKLARREIDWISRILWVSQ